MPQIRAGIAERAVQAGKHADQVNSESQRYQTNM